MTSVDETIKAELDAHRSMMGENAPTGGEEGLARQILDALGVESSFEGRGTATSKMVPENAYIVERERRDGGYAVAPASTFGYETPYLP